jgi:hypothetical protein
MIGLHDGNTYKFSSVGMAEPISHLLKIDSSFFIEIKMCLNLLRSFWFPRLGTRRLSEATSESQSDQNGD